MAPAGVATFKGGDCGNCRLGYNTARRRITNAQEITETPGRIQANYSFRSNTDEYGKAEG